MNQKNEENKNPFGDEGYKEVEASPYVKWCEGDSPYNIPLGGTIKGVLREVTERIDDVTQETTKCYNLTDKDGNEFRIFSRGKGFDSAMRKINPGQWVAFYYAADKESDKKGYSPWKMIKIYAGGMDTESALNKDEEDMPPDFLKP